MPQSRALSATVLLSLLIGTVVSTRFAMLADTRAQQAEDSFRKSELHRQAAERFSQLAREAVDKYFTRVSENTLLNQPGMQPLQRELLRDALTYYQQLAAEISDDESSEEELALALFRVGLIEEVVNTRPPPGIRPHNRVLRTHRWVMRNACRSDPL